MQNLMVMFTLFVFDQKYTYWVNLAPEFKIVCLNRNLVPRLTLTMQDLMVTFTFSVFDWKYPFWVDLVRKIKIDSLS